MNPSLLLYAILSYFATGAGGSDNTNSEPRHLLRGRNIPCPLSGALTNEYRLLCVDLSGRQLGKYGAQTIQVRSDNASWFLRDKDVVSKKACKWRGEKLNKRELATISFCRSFNHDVEKIFFAPRYMADYLSERGAQRGNCKETFKPEEIEVIHRTFEGTRPGNTQGDQSLVGLFGG